MGKRLWLWAPLQGRRVLGGESPEKNNGNKWKILSIKKTRNIDVVVPGEKKANGVSDKLHEEQAGKEQELLSSLSSPQKPEQVPG